MRFIYTKNLLEVASSGMFRRIKLVFFILVVFIIQHQVVFAQDMQIRGKVTDASSGKGLAGVSVFCKGIYVPSITDIEGNYQITVPKGITLVFSQIGYETQEVVVGISEQIDIVLTKRDLIEAVPVGYADEKKTHLTGAVASSSSNIFNKGLIVSPQELITGRLAGVSVISQDGAPGADAQILVRGMSSLSAGTQPLIVIDGLPVSEEDFQGIRNPLSLIHPLDIESITVLKDASAAAIYGGRGNHGVILIKTKRGGINSSPQISYDAQFAVSYLPKQQDIFNASEHRAYVNEKIASGDIPTEAAALLGNANTNWQDLIYRNAVSTNHNLSVSGALAKKLPYRISVGYLDQEGILKKTNFERISTTLHVDPSFFKNQLNFQLNVKGSLSKNTFNDPNLIGSALQFDPSQPTQTESTLWGGYFYYPEGANPDLPNTIAPANPLALLEQSDNQADVNRIILQGKMEYAPKQLPGFSATLHYAQDRSQSDGLNLVDRDAAFARLLIGEQEALGRRNKYDAHYRNKLLEAYLTYRRDFEKHAFSLMGGYAHQSFFREFSNVVTDFEQNLVLAPFNEPSSEDTFISFFGRLKYAVLQKYFLTLNFRRDGSSRFVEDNQWKNFASLGLSWLISEENFLKNSSFLSLLKLRASWGTTGQQNIRDSFITEVQPVQGTPNSSNANLNWEKTNDYNIGLDYDLWKGRISGSVDYFMRKTDDLLLSFFALGGFGSTGRIFTNFGSLENKGFEFHLNASLLDRGHWQLDLGYNLTTIRNEVSNLRAPDGSIGFFLTGEISGSLGSRIQIHQEGQSANSFYVFEQVYDAQGQPIENIYVDQNSDGVINDQDRMAKESSMPRVYMGFAVNVSYKNFSLGLNARANFRNYAYTNTESQSGYAQALYNLDWLNNVGAFASQSGFQNAQLSSDYYLENASFFRMDNVTLSYRFDRLGTDKLNGALSLTVQNAFVITQYKGLDPELSSGIDNNMYPRARTIVLGLHLNFR